MKEKKKASAADQLVYASEILHAKSGSSFAMIYAEGLKDAATQFSGQETITTDNAMQLIQLLLGSTGNAATIPATATSSDTG